MNTISGTENTNSPLSLLTGPSVSNKQLKQADFLKLMMTQLQLQSPFKPTDSNAMLQQMAQLSSLSTNQSLQSSIEELSKTLSSNQAIQASSVVVRSVQVGSQ